MVKDFIMDYSTVTNLSYVNAEETIIDCTVTFDGIGTVPFTASPNDPESYGQEIYAKAKAGDFGVVSPFVAYVPTSEEVTAAIIAAKRADLARLERVDSGTIRLLITLIQSLLANGTIHGSDFTTEEIELYQLALSLKGELW